jgi:hypothetical protein
MSNRADGATQVPGLPLRTLPEREVSQWWPESYPAQCVADRQSQEALSRKAMAGPHFSFAPPHVMRSQEALSRAAMAGGR